MSWLRLQDPCQLILVRGIIKLIHNLVVTSAVTPPYSDHLSKYLFIPLHIDAPFEIMEYAVLIDRAFFLIIACQGIPTLPTVV